MSEMKAHIERGDFEKALEAVSSLEDRTSDPRELGTISLNKASCYRCLRKFDEAHVECDRALDFSKDDDEGAVYGWIVKTDILADEGRYSDALSVIESSLRRYAELEQEQQLLRKAEFLAIQGEDLEAVVILSDLLGSPALDEEDIATVNHKLGISLAKLGRWDEAAWPLLKATPCPCPGLIWRIIAFGSLMSLPGDATFTQQKPTYLMRSLRWSTRMPSL